MNVITFVQDIRKFLLFLINLGFSKTDSVPIIFVIILNVQVFEPVILQNPNSFFIEPNPSIFTKKVMSSGLI